jgi:hypothetical protein
MAIDKKGGWVSPPVVKEGMSRRDRGGQKRDITVTIGEY